MYRVYKEPLPPYIRKQWKSPVTGSIWQVCFGVETSADTICYLNGRKIEISYRTERILWDLIEKKEKYDKFFK